jgi:hypothetical protein
MSFEGLFGIAGAIVVLAMVATAVQSRNTAGIISSVGNAFSESIRAARGN